MSVQKLLAATAAALLAGAAAAVPLASVKLVDHPAKGSPAGLGADGPKGVMYFKGGSSTPSCGLLPRGGQEIAPLLEPDGDESFPQCSGFVGAQRFRWGDRTVYVVRVLQRDTGEDTSESDVALITGAAGLQKPDDVDQGSMPNHKPLRSVAAWVKSQLVGAADAKAGFKPSERDLALTDGAFLAVSVDAAGGRCRFSAGSIALDAPVVPAIVPCSAVLATSAFDSGGANWFVALVKTADGRTAAHVLKADAKTAGPATDFDARLAGVAAGGKILPVRDALRKMVSGR